MTYSTQDIHLAVREDLRRARRDARTRVMAALLTGKEVSAADLAAARGMVLAERENSIFSDAWVPLAVFFLLLGFLGSRNTAVLALGAVLLLIVAVSTLWKNASLIGVAYERCFDRTRVFPGEPVTLTVNVSNQKWLPLTWLHFKDRLPVSPEQESAISQVAAAVTGHYVLHNTFSLNAFAGTRRDTVLHFPRRGFYDIGPVTYESGDIFTLFTVAREVRYLDTIVVYPQIWPLEALGLPAKEPFGERRVWRSLFTDPARTQGIRDYQPEDRFRDVHWKATARKGELQTKVYDPSIGMTIAVFLNVATFPKPWMGYDPERLERAVSVAASVAMYGLEQSWGVGVYANGAVPQSDQPIRVPPGRAPDQPAHVLEALAAVTEFATGSIENLLMRESPRLPWAATMVLVTAVVTDEIMVSLVRLHEAGRRVALISLAEDPLPQGLGSVLSYHIPGSSPVFQTQGPGIDVTESALNAIPTPVAVTRATPLETSGA